MDDTVKKFGLKGAEVIDEVLLEDHPADFPCQT
jgi:hypothetical protein